jgi:hypothetical protein
MFYAIELIMISQYTAGFYFKSFQHPSMLFNSKIPLVQNEKAKLQISPYKNYGKSI